MLEKRGAEKAPLFSWGYGVKGAGRRDDRPADRSEDLSGPGEREKQMQRGGDITINVSEVVIREEADVDRILSQIVTKLDRARRNMA